MLVSDVSTTSAIVTFRVKSGRGLVGQFCREVVGHHDSSLDSEDGHRSGSRKSVTKNSLSKDYSHYSHPDDYTRQTKVLRFPLKAASVEMSYLKEFLKNFSWEYS